MKSTTIIITFLCLYLNAYTQDKPFSPGAFIDHKGDTVKGYIDGSMKDPGVFAFKEKLTDSISEQISYEKIKKIEIGDNSFVIWTGKRSMAFIDKIEYKIANVDSFKTETIPLTQLTNGRKYSLYMYRDTIDHFFVGYDGTIEELIIKYRYLYDSEKKGSSIDQPFFTTFPIYRDQIIHIMKNKVSDRQKRKIALAEYHRAALMKLFVVLNE